MGFFSDIRNAAVEASEEVHGARLRRELLDTLSKMSVLSAGQYMEIFRRFDDNRTELLQRMGNWTREGRLKAASTFRHAAREQLDFNVVESYALWMTSAWLEAGERRSATASQVRDQLEELLRVVSAALVAQQPPRKPEQTLIGVEGKPIALAATDRDEWLGHQAEVVINALLCSACDVPRGTRPQDVAVRLDVQSRLMRRRLCMVMGGVMLALVERSNGGYGFAHALMQRIASAYRLERGTFGMWVVKACDDLSTGQGERLASLGLQEFSRYLDDPASGFDVRMLIEHACGRW